MTCEHFLFEFVEILSLLCNFFVTGGEQAKLSHKLEILQVKLVFIVCFICIAFMAFVASFGNNVHSALSLRKYDVI